MKGQEKYPCVGCQRGDPVVRQDEVVPLWKTNRIPRGVRVCTDISGYLHVPPEQDPRSGVRSNQTNAPSPEPAASGRKRRDLEGPVRRGVYEILDHLGVWYADLEQGYRPGFCRSCEKVVPGNSECPGCGRFIRGGSRVRKGLPDCLCFDGGRSWWFEFKAPGKKRDQTADQKAWQEASEELGGMPYYLIDDPAEAVRVVMHLRTRGQLPEGIPSDGDKAHDERAG